MGFSEEKNIILTAREYLLHGVSHPDPKQLLAEFFEILDRHISKGSMDISLTNFEKNVIGSGRRFVANYESQTDVVNVDFFEGAQIIKVLLQIIDKATFSVKLL